MLKQLQLIVQTCSNGAFSLSFQPETPEKNTLAVALKGEEIYLIVPRDIGYKKISELKNSLEDIIKNANINKENKKN